jgi:hypothetical protein
MFTRPLTVFRAVAVFASIALLSGCATYNRIADFPNPGKPATVAVVAMRINTFTGVPMGTYCDQERQIIVSGHQHGQIFALLLGPIGTIVVHEANASAGESRFGSSLQTSSPTDLATLTNELITEAIANQHAPGWTLAKEKPQLRVSPYALFTVNSDKAHLFAMLRAEMAGPNPNDGPIWSVRYLVRVPGERPIDGPDGWMAENRFVASMRAALRRALQACMDDCAGKLTVTKMVYVQGLMPYLKDTSRPLPFMIVCEYDDAVVARLALRDDPMCAGTYVLDRADYQFTPASFEDPRK